MPHAAIAPLLALVILILTRKRRRLPVRLNIRDLSERRIPPQLQIAYYIDLDAAAERSFEHVAYLRAAFDVSSALDGLHAYILRIIDARTNEMRATVPSVQQLHLDGNKAHARVECPAIHGLSTVILGEGAAFSPERIIGSTSESHVLLVGAGANITGGTFDVSTGPIFIGKQVNAAQHLVVG